MAFTLLTGSTGLLGGYLLRDLLCEDAAVAVVVRPGRQESVEQKIESVLQPWETRWQCALPRPVILKGDICRPHLGLDYDAHRWVSENCDALLHSAASLTFEEKQDEPRRSNVDGVRHALQLCRTASIPRFDHVSTAYVCGLRHGVVFEHELDVGQQFGNVYEQTKAEGERLVRQATHLDGYTIFRPTIIVGDWHTGYTTTFHGFYTPLRVVQSLLPRVGVQEIASAGYLASLGLKGHERKNLAPVNWVSNAILTIRRRQKRLNQTYCLASQQPVEASCLLAAFESAVARRLARQADGGDAAAAAPRNAPRASAPSAGSPEVEQEFRRQFSLYASYWRDDPTFNASNASALLPDKPCPALDADALARLCDFALDCGFGYPRRPTPPHGFSMADALARFGAQEEFADSAASELVDRFTLQCTGPGGGAWHVAQDRSGHPHCAPADSLSPSWVRLRASTVQSIARGTIAFGDAVRDGSAAGVLTDRQQRLCARLLSESLQLESAI